MKTPAMADLLVLVDAMKKEGKAVFYCLARYDTGPNKDDAYFSTKVSIPENMDPDPILGRILNEYNNEGSVKRVYATKELHDVFAALSAEGWNVLFGFGTWTAVPGNDGVTEWYRYDNRATPPSPRVSWYHLVLDQYRELMVAWSNATHKAQLVWQDEVRN